MPPDSGWAGFAREVGHAGQSPALSDEAEAVRKLQAALARDAAFAQRAIARAEQTIRLVGAGEADARKYAAAAIWGLFGVDAR